MRIASVLVAAMLVALAGFATTASSSNATTPAPVVGVSPPAEIVSAEGRTTIPLAPAADGSPRYLIDMGVVTFPHESPDSLYTLPEDLQDFPEGTTWKMEVLSGEPMIKPTILRGGDVLAPPGEAGDSPVLPRQALGAGNDKAGVYAVASGCDGYYWWAPWICQYPFDDTHATGVLATLTFQDTTLNGDLVTANWPGLVTASNDFVQIGYTKGTDTGGVNKVFVQVFRSGHFWDNCNTAYVTCNFYTPSPAFSAGDTRTYSLKSGYNGNANTWAFYAGSTVVYSTTLGSSDSGSDRPYAFEERIGSYHAAYFPQTYWDCGLCMWKSGSSSSFGAHHATYETEGSPGCPGMGSYKELAGPEFWLGSGTNNPTCPTPGSQVW